MLGHPNRESTKSPDWKLKNIIIGDEVYTVGVTSPPSNIFILVLWGLSCCLQPASLKDNLDLCFKSTIKSHVLNIKSQVQCAFLVSSHSFLIVSRFQKCSQVVSNFLSKYFAYYRLDLSRTQEMMIWALMLELKLNFFI